MNVLGISTIKNHVAGVTGKPISHKKVKETASKI
jgi:purine nucleoside phosphorylase